jgi:hypothetical protein
MQLRASPLPFDDNSDDDGPDVDLKAFPAISSLAPPREPARAHGTPSAGGVPRDFKSLIHQARAPAPPPRLRRAVLPAVFALLASAARRGPPAARSKRVPPRSGTDSATVWRAHTTVPAGQPAGGEWALRGEARGHLPQEGVGSAARAHSSGVDRRCAAVYGDGGPVLEGAHESHNVRLLCSHRRASHTARARAGSRSIAARGRLSGSAACFAALALRALRAWRVLAVERERGAATRRRRWRRCRVTA